MLSKLQAGSAFEYSYKSVGCTGNGGDGRHGRCCTCPKRKNVLQDGKIVRVVGEENKPVLRYSDFIAGMGPESSE